MTARILADTNLLVYCYDPSDPAKQRQAAEVVELVGVHGIGALSIQVLGGFVATVTRKIPRALTLDEAADRVVARLHRIPYLLSEDFNHGAILEGVRFLDPFRPGSAPRAC
jgi:predicted nucleic acid-binding protein